MKNRVPLIVTGSIFIVLVLFFVLLYLSKHDSLSFESNGILLTSLQEVKTPNEKRSEISAVEIDLGDDIKLHFGIVRKFKLITEDMIERNLDFVDFNIIERGFRLLFSYGTELSIERVGERTITLTAKIPQTVPPVYRYSIPVSHDRSDSVLRGSPRELLFSLPNGERVGLNVVKGDSLELVRKSLQVTLYSPSWEMGKGNAKEGEGHTTISEWYSLLTLPIGQEGYDAALESFREAAYENWKERYREGTIVTPSGEELYREETIVPFLTEAIRRGEYERYIDQVVNASRESSQQVTWRSALFLGNIVVKGREMVVRYRELDTLFSAGGALLADQLEDAGFELFLMGGEAIASYTSQIESLQISEEEFQKSVMRALLLSEALLLYSDGSSRETLEAIAEETLFPSILWETGELKRDNSVENRAKVAKILLNMGEIFNSSLYREGGRYLFSSLIGSEELFPPEAIYPFLPAAEYYPKVRKRRGSESWVASVFSQFQIEGERDLSLSGIFPAGSMHHLIAYNIPLFETIILYGREWREDPQFQTYPLGWSYENQTLYLKVTQRTSSEQIEILY